MAAGPGQVARWAGVADGRVGADPPGDGARPTDGLDPVAAAVVLVAPVPMVVVDDTGVVRLANRRAEIVFGRDAGGLVGSPFRSLVLPSPARSAADDDAGWTVPAAAGSGATQGPPPDAPERPGAAGAGFTTVRPDGSPAALELRTAPLPVGDDRWTIVVVDDVTRRLIAEETARVRQLVSYRQTLAAQLQRRVVRRMFTTGLTVQWVLDLVGGPARERLEQAVDELDAAVRELRDILFDAPGSPWRTGTR